MGVPCRDPFMTSTDSGVSTLKPNAMAQSDDGHDYNFDPTKPIDPKVATNCHVWKYSTPGSFWWCPTCLYVSPSVRADRTPCRYCGQDPCLCIPSGGEREADEDPTPPHVSGEQFVKDLAEFDCT